MIERIVLVTRKTALDELIERFNSRAQARFYIEHLGGDFGEYEAAHARYAAALAAVQRALPAGLKRQVIEREFLPSYLFDARDLVITVGGDGTFLRAARAVAEPKAACRWTASAWARR